MKKYSLYLLFAFFSLFLTSCDELFDLSEEPNELNGDVDIAYSEEGNTFWSSISIDNKFLPVEDSCIIKKNDNGIATFKLKIDISDYPQLKDLANMIPVDVIDDKGIVEAEFKMKITSEGIQDYFNKDGKAHTLVKYDCKVGDKYQIKKSDGTTITRKVVEKSTTDDFPYGFYYIKVITVEQDSRIPGVKKILFRANHKFGLVHVEFQMEDDSIVESYVFSKN